MRTTYLAQGEDKCVIIEWTVDNYHQLRIASGRSRLEFWGGK